MQILIEQKSYEKLTFLCIIYDKYHRSKTVLQAKDCFTTVYLPERIYNPITTMGFSAMFTF